MGTLFTRRQLVGVSGIVWSRIVLATANADAEDVRAKLSPATGSPPLASLPQETAVAGNAYSYDNALHYGADPTGERDSTQALTNAIANMAASGGSVYIPPGTYVVSSTIRCNKPGWIHGAGFGTVIAPNFAQEDVFEVTSQGVDITDMAFSPSVRRTGGYYINVTGSILNYQRLERLLLSNCYNGIGVTGEGAANQYRIVSVLMTLVANGIGVNITTRSNDVDIYLEDIFMIGPESGAQASAGVQIVNCGDVTLNNVGTVACGHGLNIVPGNGQIAQAVYVTDCFFDSGSGNGVNANPREGGTIEWMKLSDSWACTNAHGVVFGTTGAGAINLVELNNITASNNGPGGLGSFGGKGQGVWISKNVIKHTIIGGDFSHNANGILEGIGVRDFRIIGAICGSAGQFDSNTNYGIVLEGKNDNMYISGCDLQGNANGAVDIGTANQTNAQSCVIRDNLGYVTKSQGSVTLDPSATRTIVRHGLAKRPTVNQIVLQSTSSLGLASQVWVSATSAATFSISTNVNPGVGVTMSWRAGLFQ